MNAPRGYRECVQTGEEFQYLLDEWWWNSRHTIMAQSQLMDIARKADNLISQLKEAQNATN